MGKGLVELRIRLNRSTPRQRSKMPPLSGTRPDTPHNDDESSMPYSLDGNAEMNSVPCSHELRSSVQRESFRRTEGAVDAPDLVRSIFLKMRAHNAIRKIESPVALLARAVVNIRQDSCRREKLQKKGGPKEVSKRPRIMCTSLVRLWLLVNV